MIKVPSVSLPGPQLDIKQEPVAINIHIQNMLERIGNKSADKDIEAVINLVRDLRAIVNAFADAEYNDSMKQLQDRIQGDMNAYESEFKRKKGLLTWSQRERIRDYYEARYVYEYLTVIVSLAKRNGWIEGCINYYEFVCPHCNKEVVEPEANPFLKKVREVLYGEERNCTIFIEGRGGKGKSYVALKIAHELDPNFKAHNLRERIAFSPDEFMNILLNSKLEYGSVVIFDDVGVGLGAREWYDFVHKAIGFIMQTYRYKHLVTIFTHQKQREVDVQVRGRADFLIWADKKLKRLRLNKVKIYEMVEYPGGKVLPNFIRLRKGLSVEYYYFKLVDDIELIQKYEHISIAWKSNLPLELKEKIDKRREEEANKTVLMQSLACPLCGYGWVPKSKKLKPQCPSCRHTFKLSES